MPMWSAFVGAFPSSDVLMKQCMGHLLSNRSAWEERVDLNGAPASPAI